MKAGMVAALALLAMAPASAQAADGDVFRAFQDICLAPGAAPANVIRRAKAQGYFTPPPSLSRTFKGGVVNGATTLWKPFEGGMLMVIAGALPFPGVPDVDSDACVVVVTPAQGDAERQMTVGLGVGAPQRTNGQSIYVYQDQADGKRADVSAIPETRFRILQQGRLRMAVVKVDPAQDNATLTVMIPRVR